jgi:ribonuclease P protein component
MIPRLKVRAEFLAAAKAPYQARGAVVVQARRREDEDPFRVGFTATKKIGNAVARNRAKRRLREAAEAVLPLYAQPGHDYVFIARAGTIDRDWQGLLDDIKAALIRLARPNSAPKSVNPEKTVR